MVARSDSLATLRSAIINTGSGYLRNPVWSAGLTCMSCSGVPGVGYATCWACSARIGTPDLSDRLGFITYAWPSHQSGWVMYGYKASPPAPANREIVTLMLTYAVAAHWECMAAPDGSVPDGWATVPSLRGRTGDPIGVIGSKVLRSQSRVSIAAAEQIVSPRSYRPANFVVAPTTARHVLLLEDTWTTGSHVESAATALKHAGVDRVTTLVVARWLDPAWAETKQVIAGLPKTFEPDICPFTGSRC